MSVAGPAAGGATPDALEAFAAEASELDRFLSELSPEEWTQPSACAGWSISDVVLHLAQSEEGVVSSFDHGDASRPFAPYLDRLDASSTGSTAWTSANHWAAPLQTPIASTRSRAWLGGPSRTRSPSLERRHQM